MRIACIHQGYELYGSDRSFVETVMTLRNAYPSAEVEVVLPRDGPIVAALRPFATVIRFEPLFVLRRRGLAAQLLAAPVRLPLALCRAARRLARSDLVYVNTVVVLDHILAARLAPNRAVLHIHEIPEGRARAVFRALLAWSRARIVFNSNATRAAYDLPAGARARVVYNGIADPGPPAGAAYDGERPLRVLMLGRISRIKGQEVLVEALALLPEAVRRRVELRIVGNAFEDAERERALAALVAARNLTAEVTLSPFVPDPSDHYRWADIVAVPSRRPESLGRVAIEAMAFGRPPVVSAIGGLTEVVADRETGWIVPPDRPEALAEVLEEAVTQPAAWRDFRAAGRRRYERLFSATAVATAIAGVAAEVLGAAPAGTAARAPIAAEAGR
ncbi:glycosyl transferase family 1 [Aureimonas endophytica]|uniref:Glycosyl transferase family 1 n=1 Tax=Aureimonas endophytica TaxID=2027858 RepID=A0A917E7B2_9HYPH|nr:glycosyl transferase family 1 [Aureimonas endophytica]